MAQVAYSAEALEDFERIVAFLIDTSPRAARAAVEQVASAITLLGRHPRIGRRVRGHIRELVISHGASGFLALYRFEPARAIVRVLRLRHQRQAGYRD